jgi:hypothetical protein
MHGFTESPLQEVIDALQAHCGVEIQFDRNALEDVGIGSDTPITASLGGESLGEALRRILRELDLCWMVRDEVVLITTPEGRESALLTRLYPVGDLVSAGDSLELRHLQNHEIVTGDTAREFLSNRAAAYVELIEMIEATVDSTTWDSVGGPGAIVEFPQSMTLVISQTEDTHERIAKLLADVRAAQAKQNAEAVAAAPNDEPEALKNKAGERLYLKIYRLKSPKPEDAQEIAATIAELVEPASWKSGEPYVLRSVTGSVVVRHTAKTHRAIHSLLTELEVLVLPMGQMMSGGSFGGLGGGVLDLPNETNAVPTPAASE